MDLTDRLIRTAYLDLAIEKGLPLVMGPGGLPLVPEAYKEQATDRLIAYLKTKETPNDTV